MGAWDDVGYDDSWGGGGGDYYAGGGGGAAPDGMNDEGAGSDPFAYTKGSLLTPWTGHFDSSKYGGGGGGVPAYKAFNYGDFSYSAANPGNFTEQYANPGKFAYADYQSPDAFQGVTDQDMKADKGYQFRQEQGQKALTASKAAQGVLKTGGFAKGLNEYAQGVASQEYGNVYARKAGEHDRNVAEGRFSYGTNRQNNAENFDRNVTNDRAAYGVRQGAWKDNAAVTLDASRHGYDVATGSYDRNYSKARSGYEDERSHANAVAAAGAAGANREYDRALQDYNRGRDEFYTNQDRQYAILDREASRGYDAARDYGTAQTDLTTQRGNAAASGRAGSANAWGGAASGIGQSVSDTAMAYTFGDDRSGAGRGRSGGGGRPTLPGSYVPAPRAPRS